MLTCSSFSKVPLLPSALCHSLPRRPQHRDMPINPCHPPGWGCIGCAYSDRLIEVPRHSRELRFDRLTDLILIEQGRVAPVSISIRAIKPRPL